MKNYFKEFLILKKLKGRDNCTLKIESDGTVSTVKVEIFTGGFTKNKYRLIYCVCDENVLVYTPRALKFEIEVSSGVTRGLSALLIDENDTPTLFGKYGQSPELEVLLSKIKTPSVYQEGYDDEVIATENYYEVESEKQCANYQDDNRNYQNKNSPSKEKEKGGTTLYENFNGNCYSQNYYENVREKLDKIIDSYEKDFTLCSLIPESNFVKINYDKNRFYSVGTVKERGAVKYVCYAVMGSYANAPKQIVSFCDFLPLSPFNAFGDGYYVIFQNAQTGEIVSKNRN